MKKSYEMDMCNGPIFRKILVFAIPLMLSGVLQLLFNAADIVVVGQFTGSQALAAVGSTGALINLLINIFIGMSIGANVLVARYYGAQEYQHLSQTVHTAVLLSLLSGVALAVVGVAAAPVLLSWMGTPADVLDQAVLYMRIY
ncbi:MAG: MATE family efflux transporter, partial [Christensenellales bacterium]